MKLKSKINMMENNFKDKITKMNLKIIPEEEEEAGEGVEVEVDINKIITLIIENKV
jgi:hypothetical protein